MPAGRLLPVTAASAAIPAYPGYEQQSTHRVWEGGSGSRRAKSQWGQGICSENRCISRHQASVYWSACHWEFGSAGTIRSPKGVRTRRAPSGTSAGSIRRGRNLDSSVRRTAASGSLRSLAARRAAANGFSGCSSALSSLRRSRRPPLSSDDSSADCAGAWVAIGAAVASCRRDTLLPTQVTPSSGSA